MNFCNIHGGFLARPKRTTGKLFTEEFLERFCRSFGEYLKMSSTDCNSVLLRVIADLGSSKELEGSIFTVSIAF